MHLTATNIREVAQTFSSATSEWGLGREVRAASSVLRVSTGPECPENSLTEIMWDSNPNHGIVRETGGKKKPFPQKALMPHSDPWCAHRKKDWANTKGQQAGCHIGPSLPRVRGAGVWQPELEGKGLLNLSLRDCIFHQTVSRLPDPEQLICTRSVTAWDQSPEETHGTPGAVLSHHTQETECLGPGRWIRCTVHLGQWVHQAPGRLSCSDLGRAQKHTAHLGLCPCWARRTWTA